jgi:hypothetical protein
MPFILANAWLSSALMKIPEFRPSYMAILAGLASDLPLVPRHLP